MNNYTDAKQKAEFQDALGKLDGLLDKLKKDTVEKAKYYIIAKLLMCIFLVIVVGYLCKFIGVPTWTMCFPITAFTMLVSIELKQQFNKNEQQS